MNVITGETVELATTEAIAATWLNDQEVLGWSADDAMIFDASTGALIQRIGVASAFELLPGNHTPVADDDWRDGEMSVYDFETGITTVHQVPAMSAILAPLVDSTDFAWGVVGGANGSTDSFAGWILDRQTGQVASFERPLDEGGFFAFHEMTFDVDRSHAIARFNDTVVLIDAQATVTELAPGHSGSICPNGDLVVNAADGAPAVLLEGDDLSLSATLGPARWSMCVAAN